MDKIFTACAKVNTEHICYCTIICRSDAQALNKHRCKGAWTLAGLPGKGKLNNPILTTWQGEREKGKD